MIPEGLSIHPKARIRNTLKGGFYAECPVEIADQRWAALYRERLTSADCAVGLIQSGQRVFVGSNCAETQTLVDDLPGHPDHPANIEIIHIMTVGHAPYAEARYAKQFHHNTFFYGQQRA